MVETVTIEQESLEPCPSSLEEVWDKVGVKEPCSVYLTKALREVPELEEYDLEDLFVETLERRAKCNKDWCGDKAKTRQVEGEYQVILSAEEVLGEKAIMPPEDIILEARRRVRPDLYAKPGDRRHLYYREGGKERRIAIAKILDEIKKEDKQLWKELYKKFTTMPKLKPYVFRIEITTDPIAILKKSTGRPWTSCEELGREYDRGPFSDIKNWNAIGYIYPEGSSEPAGRIMLRQCRNDRGEIDIGIEPVIYHDYRIPKVLEEPLKMEIRKILRDKGFNKFEWCGTPYIYHGFSDEMRRANTQICYGKRPCHTPVEAEDKWLSKETVEGILMEYDYDAWITCPENVESFGDMFYYTNLRDFVEGYIYDIEDARILESEGLEFLTGCYEVSSYDVKEWVAYPMMIKSLVSLFKKYGIKYGVVTDPEKMPEWDEGTIVDLTETDPDLFPLHDWREYEEFESKYEEFFECIKEPFGKETFEVIRDVDVEDGEGLAETDRIRYDPRKIGGCAEKVFGVVPDVDFQKRPPRFKRKFMDKILEQINNARKYRECRAEATAEGESVSECGKYLIRNPYAPGYMYALIELDPDEVEDRFLSIKGVKPLTEFAEI